MKLFIKFLLLLVLFNVFQLDGKTWNHLRSKLVQSNKGQRKAFIQKYENNPDDFFKIYTDINNTKEFGGKTPLFEFLSLEHVFPYIAPIFLKHEDINVNFIYKNESVLTKILEIIGRNIEDDDVIIEYLSILETLVEAKKANVKQKNSAGRYGLEIVVEEIKENETRVGDKRNLFENADIYAALENLIDLVPVTKSALDAIKKKAGNETKETKDYKDFMKEAEKKLSSNTMPSTQTWKQFKVHFADPTTNTIAKLNEVLNITPRITKDNFDPNLDKISHKFFQVFTGDLNKKSADLGDPQDTNPELQTLNPLEYIFTKWDRPKLVEIFLKNNKVDLNIGYGSTAGVTNQACLKLGYNYKNNDKTSEWMRVMLKSKVNKNWNSTTSPESIMTGIQKYHKDNPGKWDKQACYLFTRIKALKLNIDQEWLNILKKELNPGDLKNATCSKLLKEEKTWHDFITNKTHKDIEEILTEHFKLGLLDDDSELFNKIADDNKVKSIFNTHTIIKQLQKPIETKNNQTPFDVAIEKENLLGVFLLLNIPEVLAQYKTKAFQFALKAAFGSVYIYNNPAMYMKTLKYMLCLHILKKMLAAGADVTAKNKENKNAVEVWWDEWNDGKSRAWTYRSTLSFYEVLPLLLQKGAQLTEQEVKTLRDLEDTDFPRTDIKKYKDFAPYVKMMESIKIKYPQHFTGKTAEAGILANLGNTSQNLKKKLQALSTKLIGLVITN